MDNDQELISEEALFREPNEKDIYPLGTLTSYFAESTLKSWPTGEELIIERTRDLNKKGAR